MATLTEAARETIEEVATKPIEEGKLTRAIENQTAKIPSVFFLSLGLAAIAASASIALMGERRRKTANFIGLWVPTFLLLGVYNKLVKIEGNDRYRRT